MIKKGILLSSSIYIMSILIGMILGSYLLNDISWFGNKGMQLSYSDIFFHNVKSNVINILGIVSFGFSTIVYLIINGVILGMTIYKGGFYVFLTKILPHGLFEISSMILISSIGLLPIWVGVYKYKSITINFNRNAIIKLFKILLLSIILLFLAAVIESIIMSGGI
ncbi:stage II sporulation protein M [Clostridium lacusfryxellense]|uniref:stage II sporulation protein M n=1 Tax=Clostridium lacusfryxellense TaxID=205328 RepID=UPI001C0BE126|nr:stage II sporulation protein M [Clostridium lacusfryxellense]MBU3114771.1 stage II sporulation protein M [Clostridium lacusfryxellense]